METCLKLSLHDAGDPADVTLYQTAIGCLIYVCNTRSNIQFVVSQVSRFMHSPRSKHWQAIKRIFRYLSGTLHLGCHDLSPQSLVEWTSFAFPWMEVRYEWFAWCMPWL